MAHACEDGSGIWVLRPTLQVPSGNWIATVLHAVKGRILNNKLSQRAVPPRRMLRGHVSPKMADLFLGQLFGVGD